MAISGRRSSSVSGTSVPRAGGRTTRGHMKRGRTCERRKTPGGGHNGKHENPTKTHQRETKETKKKLENWGLGFKLNGWAGNGGGSRRRGQLPSFSIGDGATSRPRPIAASMVPTNGSFRVRSIRTMRTLAPMAIREMLKKGWKKDSGQRLGRKRHGL